MQGRLLPKYNGHYQAHPVGYWQKEFEIARGIGLDCIEFILDYDGAKDNPLLKVGGVDEIKLISEKSFVSVKTICADYFMQAPLHCKDNKIAVQSQKIMIRLLNNISELGITDVVLPCVDNSSLNEQDSVSRFVNQLMPVVDLAEKLEINISLETDLSPQSFSKLLDFFQSTRVTVNYDIGNSASLGFDPIEELDAYGKRISDIHIKDRVLNGGPVELGYGNASFSKFFNKLREFDYQGPFIMQAYRDDEGIKIFKKQMKWFLNLMNELNYE
jgi:L-ribulose-5-phosphate 3-epimerase